ncbi:MAG: PHB depolymerase family esterase [Glaciecola sp.]
MHSHHPKTTRLLCLAASVMLVACSEQSTQSLNVDTSQVTLSGLSSGGYMATQFHIAHSDRVSGVGVIAAGPYYCALGDIGVALSACVNRTDIDIDLGAIAQTMETYRSANKIADMANLRDDKVFLIHGTLDEKVNRLAADALHTQYLQWVKPENVVYLHDQPFAHHFPTNNAGHNCDESTAPFIGACGQDIAGQLLQHLHGTMNTPAATPSGTLHTIDQQALGGPAAASLADEGYLYVPQDCAGGAVCKIHVSFHGCNQNAETVDKAYATQTGLNHWADTNQIVVLYPQTKASMLMPMNPQACWDWWGYTTPDYANQAGPQVQAIYNMINNLNQ